MHAGEESETGEGVEVSADGLGGDVESLGELGHGDPAVLVGKQDDGVLSLLRVHGVPAFPS